MSNAIVINRQNHDSAKIALDYVDTKGRVIGIWVTTWSADFVDAGPEDRTTWPTDVRGRRYFAHVQATRDGRAFGASPCEVHFATEAERHAYLAKREKNSINAAKKKGTPAT